MLLVPKQETIDMGRVEYKTTNFVIQTTQKNKIKQNLSLQAPKMLIILDC